MSPNLRLACSSGEEQSSSIASASGLFLESCIEMGGDSALLFSAVLLNQVGRVMVPSVITSIMQDPTFPLTTAHRKYQLAGVSAVCLAGKFLAATLTDKVGGWPVLAFVFAVFFASSAIIVYTHDVAIFGAMWWLNSLAYTVTWGAACQIIGVSYAEKERSAQLTRIASASRFGASIGSIFFGQMLKFGFHWRRALAPSLPVQFLLATLCCYKCMSQSSKSAQSSKSMASPSPQLSTSKWAHIVTLNFWLMFIPKVVLFTYTQFFMNFVGPMLYANYDYSHGVATQTAGLCSFGSVIGLLYLGDGVYKKLAPRSKVVLVSSMLLMCLIVPTILIFGNDIPGFVVAPLLFVWGLSYALPFYLPPGEFALEIGGKSASAFFTNMFDAGGFTMSFFWNRWTTQMSKDGDFRPVLISLALFAAMSLVSMPPCMLRMNTKRNKKLS